MPLLSRVAESLFWLGRNVERAENTARLLDVTYHARLGSHGDVAGASNTWEALVATLGLAHTFEEAGMAPSEDTIIPFLTVDRDNPSSIVSSIASARESAGSVRDFLSSETWVAINRLHHATAQRNLQLILADGLYDYCDMVRQGCHLFDGTAESTSLHDEGWYWMKVGQYLERADMVTRLVDSKYHLLMGSLDEVGGPLDRFQWTALLRSVSGYEAYRRSRSGPIEPSEIIEFLLLDSTFPRSLRASVDALQEALSSATEGAEARLRNPCMRLVTSLQTRLKYESADSLVAGGLHEYTSEVRQTLGGVNGALQRAFFWSGASAA